MAIEKNDTRAWPPTDAEIEAFAKALGYEPTGSFKELVRRVVKRWAVLPRSGN
jgi:hypothetical protein